MSTIKETWQHGEALLTNAAIENARLDAQILLCFVLAIERSVLYARPEQLLRPEQEQRYLALLERRRQHEPIAYITGHKEFYGLDFHVDPRVLIPRPETELLVERALTTINRRLDAGQVPVVADIGTGSGAIPVTILVAVPRLSYLYACDISSAALAVTRLNARSHQVEERLHLLQGDLVAPLPEPVDLLVANLPYVGTAEMSSMTKDVFGYEPHLALFSGQDGLSLLQRFCIDVQRMSILKVGGEMLLEIGYQQGNVVARLLRDLWPEADVVIGKDYAGFDRFIFVAL